MYRKILVATDGSEISGRASRQALALAKALGAEALAVSVIDTRTDAAAHTYLPGTELSSYYFPLLEHLRGYARECVEAVVAEGRKLGVAVKPEVLEGIPAPSILDLAGKWGADLVVMGTQGRTGLKLLLLGSTAQAVLHGATIPVLLVR
jgi:nucleotide-binding universal stress UspA family protein